MFQGATETSQPTQSAPSGDPLPDFSKITIYTPDTPKDRTLTECFPFPEIRPTQVRALGAWEKTLAGNKRFAVFEMPTGSGKSPTAWAVGDHATQWGDEDPTHQPGAYVITTQKSLQTQYLRDFAKLGLVEVKGATNYRCNTHGSDCQTGALLNKVNKKTVDDAKASEADPEKLQRVMAANPSGCSSCPYTAAKNVFRSTPIGVTNFSFLLSVAKSGAYKTRSVLIIDEAHNCEAQILAHVELDLTKQRAEMVGSGAPPIIAPGDVTTARSWVLDTFRPSLIATVKDIASAVAMASDRDERDRLAKREAALTQFASKFTFLDDEEQMKEWYAHTDEKTGALKLRPLTARAIAESTLFKMGSKLLFMSATILDGQAFIRGLGLSGTDGGVLRVDSDFPVENRLVRVVPCGSMSYKNIDSTLPKLVKKVEAILDKHPMVKGIVHSQSYRVNQAIVEHLRGTKHRSRLITHDSSYGARDRAIFQHTQDEEPSVLISPSMTEGLDLSEDLCRFQILAKCPYPFLGDPFVKARMEFDPKWYVWATAISIVQATGRGVRSREDCATTYLLDSDFERFLQDAESILPGWWKKALVFRN